METGCSKSPNSNNFFLFPFLLSRCRIVPQIFRAAAYVRELDPSDLRVLVGIELGMRRFEFVPVDQISFYARLNKSEAQYRLDKLHKSGILQRNSQLGYVGYQLITESYDVLALHALVEKDVIVTVGSPIGRGKESDVFYAQLPDKTEVAVKIHRIGQTSFRQVRKLRNYIKNRKHISWLYVSRLSAEREYAALQQLEQYHIGTPKVYGQNRHMVVMEFILGMELSRAPPLQHPLDVLNDILNKVAIMFQEANIIHGDLCEFNILIDEEEHVRIIDFPQWEPADHPNAVSYLTRDVENIAIFFEKHYQVTFDTQEFLDKMFSPESEPESEHD